MGFGGQLSVIRVLQQTLPAVLIPARFSVGLRQFLDIGLIISEYTRQRWLQVNEATDPQV